VEHALEEGEVARVVVPRTSAPLSIDLKHAPCCPPVNRRIHVAEGPFVGGQLTVRVHVPLARQQDQLVFGEFWIDERERDVWNARSHAAYHGYSHLSGIEMMSALCR
jgi:hypothetical protein